MTSGHAAGAVLLAAGRQALTAAYLRTGDYDAVVPFLDEALAAAKNAGDRGTEAVVVGQQGMLLHFRAIELPSEERAAIDPGTEQELFERALAIHRDIEDTEGIAESMFRLGLVQQVLRRDASLELRETLDERGWVVGGLVALALAERLAGLRDEAIAHGRGAVRLARALRLRRRHVDAASNELIAAEHMTAARANRVPGDMPPSARGACDT